MEHVQTFRCIQSRYMSVYIWEKLWARASSICLLLDVKYILQGLRVPKRVLSVMQWLALLAHKHSKKLE